MRTSLALIKARRIPAASEQHQENQLELQRLVRVCFGAHYGLKSDIAPSPKSANLGSEGV
jgi:hypothetical protein